MTIAIKIENVSKQYRLGTVGTGTMSHDLNRWWHRIRGKDDPYTKVGQVNKRDQAADSEYVWALKDINLEVPQGEVLGVIGANGAGKSTLLKIISRITSPTTGAIKAKGRIASLLEVGTGMNEEMTARENVFLNGSILGMRRYEISRKFDDIIDFAGCRMYVDTPVKRYSSGMRVRLGFAVAAFLEPEILIVDEVLAVGDAEFQRRAVGKMQDISEGSGRTILFVSHNMGMIRSLCDRTVVMQHGGVAFHGDCEAGVDFFIHMMEGVVPSNSVFELPEKQDLDLQIRVARIVDGSGRVLQKIPMFGQAALELEYSVRRPLEGVNLGMTISHRQARLFLSFDTDETPELWNERQPGDYKATIDLPTEILKAGRYQLSLACGITNGSVIQSCTDCIRFEVYESDNFSLRSYSDRRPGMLAAKLPWKTEELTSTSRIRK